MSEMKALWLSIRPVNLLIIALTMAGVWFAMSKLLFLQGPSFAICGYMVAIVLLAAGGNILNDIVDQENDQINERTRNQVGRAISGKKALSIYWIFTLVGLLIGLITCTIEQHLTAFLLLLFTAGSLWFYSRKMQGQLIMGNLTIAILVTIPVILAGLAVTKDLPRLAVTADSSSLLPTSLHLFKCFWLFFIFFAFALTFIRELIKDIEDQKGDSLVGYRTFPVVYGFKVSKQLALLLAIVALALEILFIYWFYWREPWIHRFWLAAAFLIPGPMLIVIVEIMRMRDSRSARIPSILLKVSMLLGLSTCLFFAFL